MDLDYGGNCMDNGGGDH